MKVIGYGRVSTKAQKTDGHSLDYQRRVLERMALERGWTMLWMHDVATGTNDDRPQYKEALRMLEAGEVSGLCVSKFDRVFRSIVDFGQFMEKCKKHRWQFVALDLAIDTSTPVGEFMLNILASIAQLEVEMIRERTKAGLAEARAKGIPLGTLQGKRLRPSILAEIRKDYADGYSLRSIARWLESKKIRTPSGHKKWSDMAVHRALNESAAERRKAVARYRKEAPYRQAREQKRKLAKTLNKK